MDRSTQGSVYSKYLSNRKVLTCTRAMRVSSLLLINNLLKLTDIVCDYSERTSAVLSVSAIKDIQKCSPFNKMKQTVTKSEVII